LSVLKHENEALSNAEKRASDEVHSLSERGQRLQASLGTIQSAKEVRELRKPLTRPDEKLKSGFWELQLRSNGRELLCFVIGIPTQSGNLRTWRGLYLNG
ncbi:hypothetical protein S83_031987, partial [Arachis hypogaea]